MLNIDTRSPSHNIVKIVCKANQIVSIIRMTYEDRSDNTRVYSRRLRSDLIEVYKIMHNFEGLNREDFFFLLRSAPEDDINMYHKAVQSP